MKRIWWRAARFAGLAFAAMTTLMACDSVEERVVDHYERAEALYAEGDYAKAGVEYRNALKLDENHVGSRYGIALLYERDGELQAVVSNLRLVTELDPQHLPSRTLLARYYLAGGNLESAQQLSLEAEALAPEDPDVLSLRAGVLFRSDEILPAMEYAARALEKDPANVEAAVIQASERLRFDDMDGALTRVDQALALSPEAVALHLIKLNILQRREDLDAIIAQLRVMVERFPEQREYKAALVRALQTAGRNDDVESLLRTLADEEPDNPTAAIDLTRWIATRDRTAASVELDARIAAAQGAARDTLRLARVELAFADDRPEDARAELTALIDDAATPENADQARIRLARDAVARKDLDTAGALIDAVLERDAENVAALSLRGALLTESLDVDEAVSVLRKAASLDPVNHEIMLLLARAYERAGSTDLAGERLAAAVQASQYDPGTVLSYARFLRRRGQPDAVFALLRDAVDRRPEAAPLLAALAEEHLRREEWADAEAIARRFNTVQGGETVSARIMAAAAAAQGQEDRSLAILQDLNTRENSDSSAFAALLSAYLRAGEADRARALVDERLAVDPDDAVALLMRAELELAGGDVAAAEATLEEVIAANPSVTLGYRALARLALAQGDLAKADAAAARGLDNGAPPQDLLFLRAQIAEQRQDFDTAIAVYETLYDIVSDNLVVANNLAALLAEHRYDDEAVLRRAARIARRLRDSPVPEFLDTYGWTSHLVGDRQNALAALVEAVRQRPDHALIRYHAGVVLAEAGQTEIAREHLETALEIDPAFVKADSARARLASLPQPAPAAD